MVRIITMIVIGFLFVNSVNAQTNEKYFEHNLKQGDTLVFFSKFDKAIDLYESLLQNPSTGAMGKVMLLNKLSAVHRLYKRYDKALEYAQQAKAKSVLMNSKTQEAEAMDNIGAIHVSRRVHLDKAMVLHEKALKLKLKHSPRDSLSIAYSHFYIGKVLHFQRLSNKAIDAYQQSLSLLMESTLDATRLKLNLWYSLGASYAYLGDNDACFKWLNKALKTSKKLMPEEGTLHISIYSALASYYRYQYEPNKAIQYYNNALNLSIKYFGFNHDDQAKIHINIGNAYNEANELDKAIYHLQKGNEMMAKIYGEKHKYLFNIYVILGNAYYDNEGLQYLKKALDLCLDTVGENHWKTALVYRCMSNIYFELKQYQRAVEFGTKCLEIDQRIYGETHIVMVDHYNSISEIYNALGNFKKALEFNQKAIKYNQLQNDDGSYNLQDNYDVNVFLTSLKIKGDIYLAKHKTGHTILDLKESAAIYTKAINLIDELQHINYNYYDQIILSETAIPIYEKNIETSLLLHSHNQNQNVLLTAFENSEQSKARTLGRLFNQSNAKQIVKLPETILNTEYKIDSIIAQVETEITNIKSATTIDSTQLYHWEGKLLGLNQQKDSLEATIETRYPKYYDLKYANRTFTVSQTQEKLDANTSFIEFFVGKDTIYAFVITKTSFVVREIPIQNLDEQVEKLQNNIIAKHEEEYQQTAHQLYQKLIEPIRKDLIGDQLIIVPDGSLWHLPFDVLLTKSYDASTQQSPAYFIKDFAVSYANSARFLFKDYEETSQKKVILDECIAFSYTSKDSLTSNTNNTLALRTLRDANRDLPGTREEVRALSEIFNGLYYYNYDANEMNFKNKAQNYGIIHLAVHGSIDNKNPENSMLYFSPSENKNSSEDNILYNHELLSLDIPARLVVLSACNTGTGKLNSGEGISSLGQAFQYAGTQSLLLSKWEVSDKTTPEIMKGFYGYLKQGMDKSRALQKTKLDFLANSDQFIKAPFFWGNFYILGSTSPVIHKSLFSLEYMVYFLLLIIASVIVYKIISKRKMNV